MQSNNETTRDDRSRNLQAFMRLPADPLMQALLRNNHPQP
jgi:hypothetical protein